MTLESNEYTEELLLQTLKEKYKTKRNGQRFTKNDIVQYSIRGQLPKWYGGNVIEISEQYGIKILTLIDGK